MEEVKKNNTLYKVLFSFLGVILLGILSMVIYMVITNIQSVLILIVAAIAIFFIGYVVLRISYFLFSTLLLFAGIAAFLSLIGWGIHWFG